MLFPSTFIAISFHSEIKGVEGNSNFIIAISFHSTELLFPSIFYWNGFRESDDVWSNNDEAFLAKSWTILNEYIFLKINPFWNILKVNLISSCFFCQIKDWSLVNLFFLYLAWWVNDFLVLFALGLLCWPDNIRLTKSISVKNGRE